MNIGFFVFNSQEEFERKQAMLDKAKCTEKMYSGDNENAFSEFAITALNSGYTVYLPSLKDLGETFGQLINAFEYVEKNNIRLVFLEGIQNELLFGATEETAATAVKAFMRLLEREQIC